MRNKREAAPQPQWGEDVQRVLLSFMLSDPTAFTQSRSIISDVYFEDRLRPAVRCILDYADKYRTLPTAAQVEATTGVEVEKFDGCEPQHTQWYLESIEAFCRHRALELAILSGVDLLGEGNYAEVESRVKAAMQISLMTDLGTDYWSDPRARLERMRDRSNYFTTGWAAMDEKLYGGFARGALNVFAGGSGAGKSLILQNLALNWAYRNLNVVYFTLELSEDLVSSRLDAMVTGYGTRDILRRVDDVVPSVLMHGRDAGTLRVKKFPEAGTNTNHLRAYLKELEIKTGQKPDAVLVDYLDLMHPINSRIDPSDLFVKDKYVSEELRAMSGDMDLFMATASQLNRGAVEASEFDHSHIAGGISKINTADNVFALYAPAAMREQGRYQIQFLKTRSAAAVGQRIDLKFDPVSLRIEDADPTEHVAKPMDNASLRAAAKGAGGATAVAEDAQARIARFRSLGTSKHAP